MARSSGVLCHVTALPCEYGIGDFGEASFNFVKFLHRTKHEVWQVLPLGSTLNFCPYSLCSSFALNELLISPQILQEQGYIKSEDLNEYKRQLKEFVKENTHSLCLDEEKLKTDLQQYGCTTYDLNSFVDFEIVKKLKKNLFIKAFKTFNETNSPELNKFKEENKFWLNDFCNFMSLREHFGKIWLEWPEEFKVRNRATNNMTEELKHSSDIHMFLQFESHRQWSNLIEFCKKQNVQLFGDVGIYIDLDSADCWSMPDIFDLDSSFQPRFVSGVPPDYFSEYGQLWNHPVYNWENLEKTNYKWWVERLAKNLNLFDILRIDHFRGLSSFYKIPREYAETERNAKVGEWEDAHGEKMLKVFFKELCDKQNCDAETVSNDEDTFRSPDENDGGKKNLSRRTPSNDESIATKKLRLNSGESLDANLTATTKPNVSLRKKIFDPPIVAEDLGIITEDVVKLRHQFNLAAMRVFQFGFGDIKNSRNDHLFFNIPNNSVAYTATHDNYTTVGWAQTVETNVKTHLNMLTNVDLMGCHKCYEICQSNLEGSPAENDLNDIQSLSRLLWLTYMSSARLCIAPIQDLMKLDNKARFNDPANGGNALNWRWRMTHDDGMAYATTEIEEKMIYLSQISGRC